MGAWESFRGLSSRTRLLVGVGIIAWGVIGLRLSDAAEKKLGLSPTELDRARLREGLPSRRTGQEGEEGKAGKA